MAAAVAQVVGLKALMKDVDKLCKDERSALFAAMKKAGYAAVKPVATTARDKIPHSARKPSRTHRPGAIAGSARPSAYRSGAAARLGSSKAPFGGWLEFGGKRPHGGYRTYVSGGRYLYPAALNLGNEAARQYTEAINDIFGRTAIWTNTTNNGEAVHD